MDDSEKKRVNGKFCVAGIDSKRSCTNNSNTPGVSMHMFPKNPVIRQKWIKFVQKRRVDFKAPTAYSALCSAHFKDECFTRPPSLEVLVVGEKLKRVLVPGAVPTNDCTAKNDKEGPSERENRQVSSSAARPSNCVTNVDHDRLNV